MQEKLKNIFKNKKILVTGGTGCIGGEIVRRLLPFKPDVVRIFSNDEDNTFRMMQELGIRKEVRFLVGDIRDKERLIQAMEGIDIVYHAAALKHVPLCEYNPFEAIKTNVLGTQNVIESSLFSGVSKVISISTDKAVNPANTMGATKLLAEKLIIDANFYKGKSRTIFSCVRFGNVLFSRGSVIPLFIDQIKNQKMITITDESMTRFMMSIENTIDLVFKSTIMAKGGEIFILKMPVVKMGDVADVVIDKICKECGFVKSKVKKKKIGPRSGEKMYEELMTENESEKAFETKDMFIIPPTSDFQNGEYLVKNYSNAKKSKMQSYASRDVKILNKSEIQKMLFGKSK